MGRTTDLRRAIKRSFVPLMEGKGFLTDQRYMPQFLIFRRITPERIYVCDIQWEKSGRPRFVLNFGSCGPLGVVLRGTDVEPSDVWPAITPWRGRLMPGPPPFIRNWFRQDRRLLQRLWLGIPLKLPEGVVSELIALFPEVENYWDNGVIGAHITVMGMRASKDKVGA
jgi:hypothetical protein